MTQPSKPTRLPAVLIATMLAACVVSMLSFGVRAAFGLFTEPLPRELGISREVYSMAIALQNLCWGVTQPFAGHLTDKFGARRVMVGGAALYAAGIAGLAVATSPVQIYLSAGVLVGVGMGGASFTTALAALGRVMPESHRTWALGLGTAAGSLGQFVIVPLTQAVVDATGLQSGMWMLATALCVAVLAALLVRDGDIDQAPTSRPGIGTGKMLGAAFSHSSYVYLVLGFFVCGFQLAFITTHFPAYLSDKGLPATTASWALALVGLVNILGAYLAGVWGGMFSKKWLLSAIYLARGILTLAFLLMPLSTSTVLAFSAGMGLLWLSTVPLTSALVATFFGVRFMATLFGIVFFSHQVGSFLGIYLGGIVFERTGSYRDVWVLSIGLSLFAAVMNMPIREERSESFERLAAS